jgi:hypothetical protein
MRKCDVLHVNVHEVLLCKYVTAILINYVYNVKVHNLQVLIFLSFALWLLALVLCCLWPGLNPQGPPRQATGQSQDVPSTLEASPKRNFKGFQGI